MDQNKAPKQKTLAMISTLPLQVLKQPLLGRELHQRYDEYGIIQVFDDGNKRYLSFGTADEQSCQLLARPNQPQHDYSRAMISVLNVMSAAPSRVAILGTGGGLLARALFEHLDDVVIDAVDLRQAVIQVAYQYFGLPRSSKLKTHALSAHDFIAQAPDNHYELLFSDLYLADGLDLQQLQTTFIEHCQRVLQEDGWLVLNLWKEHRENGVMLPLLRQYFLTVMHATTTDGNWIIWASNTKQTIPGKTEARKKAKQLSELFGFNMWRAAKGFYKS